MTYRLSRKAEDDIRNIYVFGARTFGVDQAERYFAGLFETFDFLAQFPLAARLRTELSHETRAHPFQSHLIFYRGHFHPARPPFERRLGIISAHRVSDQGC